MSALTRPVLMLALLSIGFASGCALFTLTSGPTFTVSPSSGPSGASVTLDLTGAQAGQTVVFTEVGAAGQETQAADSSGNASATFIPQGEPGTVITYQAEIAPGTPQAQTLTATYTIQ